MAFLALKRWRARVRSALMWKRHRLLLERLHREHPLRYLFMEVTRQCNLACRYCGSSCSGRAPDGELSAAEWTAVARQVAEGFDAKKVMVAVTGGEPLLKDGIFELFETLRRYRFPYGMVTNGQILDAPMARRLVNVGIGSISLSMDALPELNDELRGRGSSAKVEAAIGHLRAAGFKGKLEIISTITRPAVASLEEMRRYVARLRVPMWRVAPVMPIGRAAEHPELLPDATQVRTILEFVRESRLDSLVPRPEFSEEGYLGERFEGRVRPYLCQCRAGVTVAGIRANGKIAACPELSAAFDQGDIRTEAFKDVWQQRYEVFRDRSWTRAGACGDCEQFTRCRGGAMHLYDAPGQEFLRCLYLMCKETDGKLVPRPIAQSPKAPSPGAGTA
jgi:radical SAM protein with 4Fe4S-binding SPASM domain